MPNDTSQAAAATTAMEQEMHQAPAALAALCGRLGGERGALFGEPWAPILARADRILWAACGSSRHAGLLGKVALAALAGVPSQVEEAHELGTLDEAIWRDQRLCVALSQSGETQDTLEAQSLAAAHHVPVLSVANVEDSTLMRRAQHRLALEAGEERAVPATKSFLAQGAACLLLAAAVGTARAAATGDARAGERRAVQADLARLPEALAALYRALAPGGDQRAAMEAATRLCAERRQSVFVGRGANVAIAQEAALKLQESAYLPARAFALGEIKHGPMAMLEPGLDVVVALVGPNEPERTRAGVERLLAVGVPGIVVAAQGEPLGPELLARANGGVLVQVPRLHPLVWPLLAAAVMQRLSLDCAAARGVSVDRPRYLVKQILTV